jgi:5-methylcytosine-specific restriction enzyme subunit McrC
LKTSSLKPSNNRTALDIPIANIYYLLCYAWDALEEKDALAEVDHSESPELLDLFARVLVSGTRRLLRRGFDRGYLLQEGHIAGVRGKIVVTETIRRDLLAQGRTACVWDDLEYDTLPNQILKTTLELLYRHTAIEEATRADLHDLLRWLSPVQCLQLRSEHFRRLQLHRNNRIYSFLLHVCEFIYEQWLPEESGGQRRFRDFVRDGLPGLFEKFVFNFYQRELGPDWQVTAPVIYWQMATFNPEAERFVPRMETDICLRGPTQSIILDTKFYASALKKGPYGEAKLPAANLYQLYTYLRQKSADSGWEQAEGILLYPRTTQDVTIEFTTHGHRIRALTLDLAQPWKQIHKDLLHIFTPALQVPELV